MQSTGYHGALVTVSDGVSTHNMDEDGETIADPHAWQSLSNGLLYIENIAQRPLRRGRVRLRDLPRQTAAYEAEIIALDAEVKSRIATVPGRQAQGDHHP